MSSILTNTSAMVALQTLKSVNSNLQETQSQISTGKSVASAKDNSAVWAISKSMDSDVKGFMAISESLALGESTVAVARNASETVTELLTEIKGRIVAAQESNVDRTKIQTDIDELTDQIRTVVDAAQFNGLNLVKGQESVDILSSLDRSSSGVVSASNISIDRQDLTDTAGTYGADGAKGATSVVAGVTEIDSTGEDNQVTLTATVGSASTGTIDITIGTETITGIAVGADADATANNIRSALSGNPDLPDIAVSGTGADIILRNTASFDDFNVSWSSSEAANTVEAANAGEGADVTTAQTGATVIDKRAERVVLAATTVASGDSFRATVGTENFEYIAGEGETMEDVARGLKSAIDSGDVEGVTTRIQDAGAGAWDVLVDYGGSGQIAFSVDDNTGGTASGGLFGLDDIDVSTNTGAANALGNVETLIQNSIDAAANFGSAEGRIEIQAEFVGKLMDSLKAGIGSLVDANMEEASARLQALQVQQQLATQSLSIANQAPQNILALFR
jgi:flagellin